MSPERWKQIDELLDAALDLPENERDAFLSEKCTDDNELKKEVLALLKAQNPTHNFLENPAIGLAAQNLAELQTIADTDHLIGKKIATYKIEKILGVGGMGQVFLAHDEKLNRKVALKILPTEFTSNDERVKRFQMEARAVSALNHPNIVTIHDVGTFEGINYIATEYVEGKTLRELIGNKLKTGEILEIIIQCCEALSAAHNAKIIHRDIKPENIIIRPDGYVKILDFGLAKLSEVALDNLSNFAKTDRGVIIGTPAYMSPVQISDGKIDQRTDLWSIGLVLYELLTGKNPFKKNTRQLTFQAILQENPLFPSYLNPEIPADFDPIMVKALEKNPDLSYQTASDLRADLKRLKREIDSSPSWNSGSATGQQADTGTKRRYLLFTFYFLLFTSLAFGAWYFYFRNASNLTNSAIEWSDANNLQITQTSEIEYFPSLSPDGKTIVYSGEENGDRNIYWQRVGGKSAKNITPNSKETETTPAFSPNGKLIAFRSERQECGVFVMEETGENVRKISDIGYHPSWSPDSKKIVVSDALVSVHTGYVNPTSSLWIIDVETSTKQKLETNGDAIMPNWSPNGHRIAFWSVADGKLGEIFTVPAEGGEPVPVSPDEATDWNPVWSPDGKFLYFASDRGGNMNFWRIPIDEKTGKTLGEAESIGMPSKYPRHLTFSRDSKTLAYSRFEGQSNLQSLAFDPKTLKVSGEPVWITRGDREISHPTLSPNGEDFLMRIPSRIQDDIGILKKDSQSPQMLTNDKFRESRPRWSPDGKKVYFASDRSGKSQIWAINPDGTNLQQITFTEKTGANTPIPSPDGVSLAFSELDGTSQKTFILNLTKSWQEQTPQPVPPPSPNQSITGRDWSSDGKKLLYAFADSGADGDGISVYDFETKTHEKMTENGLLPYWLKDNRHFIYTYQNSIWAVDTQTKKSVKVYSPPFYNIQQANISPDNKSLIFRYLQIDSDIWVKDATQNQ